MKAYLYSAIVLLSGCAYGVGDQPKEDAAVTHVDAGVKDAKTQPVEASVQDVSQTLPDVWTAPTCAPPPLATGIPLCDTCIGANCCTEDTTCANDTDCMSLINCEGACQPLDGGLPDTQCLSSCASSYPTGSNELSALDSCLSGACRNDCFGP